MYYGHYTASRYARKIENDFNQVDLGIDWIDMLCQRTERQAQKLLADTKELEERLYLDDS